MIEKNYNKILKVIRINLNEEEKGKYSHRNYLGGIVKLGIKREKVGDILVSDDGADIIVKEETSETLKTELSTLTRFENAELKIIEYQELREQEIKLEEINIIVPSLRLDNFVSDLAKTSRSKAVQIIDSERVFINGQNELKASKQVKLGDVITIRGKGRFVVKEFSGSTRSGRTVVKIEKYV
jgi:RNA-binding protein YlmH